MAERDEPMCDDGCTCHSIPRRDFIKLGGVAATTLAFGRLNLGSGPSKPFNPPAPQDKGLSPEWLRLNLQRGEPLTYRADDLRFIGMPVGGICAGEVLVGGDGQLWLWDIFNQIKFGLVNQTVRYAGQDLNAGGGANYVESPDQLHPFKQGFALLVEGEGRTREMNRSGWKDVSFTGQYPIGFIHYQDPECPVEVDLETFSPFIPLESENSEMPAVVQRFTLKNRSDRTVSVQFGGWLENPVCLHSLQPSDGHLENRFVRSGTTSSIECVLRPNPPASTDRSDIVFDDFEKSTYEGWTVFGNAFGPGPIEKSKMPSYQGNVGGHGKRVACSFNARNGETVEAGDNYKGKLVSREFAIERKFIAFYIGGGNHPGKCCLNLVLDGKIVRTATGKNREEMDREGFEVSEFAGQRAHLEIVDDQEGDGATSRSTTSFSPIASPDLSPSGIGATLGTSHYLC